jgi:hypothetical protein
LLKTDDDVFVNSPVLFDFLSQDFSPWGPQRLILCQTHTSGYVHRSSKSKWRVTKLEYPGKKYPPFCAGWAVLYSPDVGFLLYREAQRSEYFWLDDVQVTGILAARVNLSQTTMGSLMLPRQKMKPLLGSRSKGSEIGFFLFGPPQLSSTEIRGLWQVVQDRRSASEHHKCL